MGKIIGAIIAIIAAIIIGAVVIANNNGTTTTNTTNPQPVSPPPTTSQPAAKATKVSLADMAFSPAEITVKKGTKVTWTNSDSVTHTVTGDNGGPSSENLENGESYSYTFDETGTFKYHCTIHPSMTGTVTVTE